MPPPPPSLNTHITIHDVFISFGMARPTGLPRRMRDAVAEKLGTREVDGDEQKSTTFFPSPTTTSSWNNEEIKGQRWGLFLPSYQEKIRALSLSLSSRDVYISLTAILVSLVIHPSLFLSLSLYLASRPHHPVLMSSTACSVVNHVFYSLARI